MQTFYQFEHFVAKQGLLHAVTKKDTTKDYHFSLALHTKQNRDKIISNRSQLVNMLGARDDTVFVTANQTHSDHVVVIDSIEMRGWSDLGSAIEDCDALVTDKEGVVLGILTADCVPILLYDPARRVIAAVHAGWRGTQKQIVAKTIKSMIDRFDCDPADILAGVAPAIGGCCYEVGDDVASHLLGYSGAIEQLGEKYMLDLPSINRDQMIASGIQKINIQMSGICTACEVESYFSYRKEQGCSGRFMSVIGMR